MTKQSHRQHKENKAGHVTHENEISINCLKHGAVVLFIDRDTDVLRVCPVCAHAACHPQEQTDAPYPLQGTSPSVIPELNRGD